MRLIRGKIGILSLGLFGLLSALPSIANAAPITFRHKHHLFTINPDKYPQWKSMREVWTYRGVEMTPPPSFLVDGDEIPPLPEGVQRSELLDWNVEAIKNTLASIIGDFLHRDAGSVTISRSGSGKIVFDGVGLPGRDIDLDITARLTIAAIEQGISDIEISVVETQPTITVTDPELQAEGIKEVVTVGESDFSNSPNARRHNIAVGLAKFNGHVIPKGTTFSFDETLGPVNGATGYKKELVIKGDRTIPDYGGGLCQVSSTAYRGIWEYGFPIVQRKNHSFAVNHYAPQGTDATVYPPSVDMKFKNDSPGALLMQTHTIGDLAFFIYYGTKDDRKSEVIGPFIWGRTSAPPDKFEYTTDLAPGARKKIGERIPGMSTLWYRFTQSGTGATKKEAVYSVYEARPLFYQVGVEAGMVAQPTEDLVPTEPLTNPPEIKLPKSRSSSSKPSSQGRPRPRAL